MPGLEKQGTGEERSSPVSSYSSFLLGIPDEMAGLLSDLSAQSLAQKIGRFWPVLTQQTIGVFVQSTFPRMIWTRKVILEHQRAGRPSIDTEIRKLIRQMQSENIGWGAPRIHGELLKLGMNISQATVSKYMLHRRKPPSQTWRTFLENHADCLAAIDFFTIQTATFRIHFVLMVLSHDRRHIVHINLTAHPTPQSTAQQLV